MVVPSLVDLIVIQICAQKDFYRLSEQLDFLPEYVVMKIFMQLYSTSKLDAELVQAFLKSKYEFVSSTMKKLDFDIFSGVNSPHKYGCRS